jgi:HisA/HisF family protein
MRIVPVVDILAGQAVRAVEGRREDYAPLVSPLAATSDPLDIVAGYLRLYPFPTVYVADLDAILGKGDNAPILARLAEAHPDLEVWLDRGARAPLPHRGFRGVVGSETLDPVEAPPDLSDREDAILSLDYRGAQFIGPPTLPASPLLWPRRVVVMSLTRVGAKSGPDFETLATIAKRAGAREIYAAGGTRGADDLRSLAAIGVAGVLVASALHDGRLNPGRLDRDVSP